MNRFAFIAAAALAASACQVGADAEERDPGSTVSRTYQIGAFEKIVVGGPYEVTVTTGGKPGVSAKGGDRLLDETEVVVEGDTLKIIPKKKGPRINWGKNGTAQFNVSTERLRGAVIAGSGGITVDKIDGDFKGQVAGSGDLRLAAINDGAPELTIAGSGKITAAGKARSAKLIIAGSGDIDAHALAAIDVEVGIAGSGNVRANASGTATVEIMGSGDVSVTGGAKCKVSKAGSGSVSCR